jgi:hypothetical protein
MRPTTHREPQDVWQRRSPPWQGGGVQSRRTRGGAGAVPSRVASSGASGHVVAPELTLAGRRGLEPQDMWQRQSPPQHGSGVRSHGARGTWQYRSHEARGGTGALLTWEAGSGTVVHMAARPALCLGLMPVCGDIRSTGYQQ